MILATSVTFMNFVSFVDVVILSVGIYIYYIILKQKCSCSRIHFYVLSKIMKMLRTLIRDYKTEK